MQRSEQAAVLNRTRRAIRAEGQSDRMPVVIMRMTYSRSA
jgi:hypothetical protein